MIGEKHTKPPVCDRVFDFRSVLLIGGFSGNLRGFLELLSQTFFRQSPNCRLAALCASDEAVLLHRGHHSLNDIHILVTQESSLTDVSHRGAVSDRPLEIS